MIPARALLALTAGWPAVVLLVAEAGAVRVATFNASLNRPAPGQLAAELATPDNTQAKRIAEIIQRVAPDIILINEFDHDPDGTALDRFHDNYLAVAQNGQPALLFPWRFTAPSNTGTRTGETAVSRGDFDNNGEVVTAPGATDSSKDNYGDDCFGFGWFPGQYGMAVYSRFPIDRDQVRTFQLFRWSDLPAPAWPDMAASPEPADWFTVDEKSILRLSSKSHWDLPIELAPARVMHLLASHPTPPVFDGAEDRNGRRNHDEIRFWAEYLSNAPWIYDDPSSPADESGFGGLPAGSRFVVLGDQNADPLKGDSYQHAIRQLLDHPLVNASFTPSSAGGGTDTANFASGWLRVDHVLPSKAGWSILGGGVFWPTTSQPGAALLSASDHRLVWLDLAPAPVIESAVRDLTIGAAGNDVTLTWMSEPGITYTVERSSDLRTWTSPPSIAVNIDSQTGIAIATDEGAIDRPPECYRVVAAFTE